MGYGRPVQTANVRVIRSIGDLTNEVLLAIIGETEGAEEREGTAVIN